MREWSYTENSELIIFVPYSEHPSSDYSDDDDDNEEEQEEGSDDKEDQEKKDRPLWTVVCSTEEEWQQLAESFKKSKHKDEKMLYETLSVDFVPEIGKMIEAKVIKLLALNVWLIRFDKGLYSPPYLHGWIMASLFLVKWS